MATAGSPEAAVRRLNAEVNKGRLCPRGNSANIVIDHRDRLCRPLLDGRNTTWAEAEALIHTWLGEVKPEAIGIVYSRGRAAEFARLKGPLTRAERRGKYLMLVEGSVPMADGGVYCCIGGRTAIDIVRETDDTPPGCQWAVFLRNHDELTLEMVTDEDAQKPLPDLAAGEDLTLVIDTDSCG